MHFPRICLHYLELEHSQTNNLFFRSWIFPPELSAHLKTKGNRGYHGMPVTTARYLDFSWCRMNACITITAICSVLRISFSCCISSIRVVVLFITRPCCHNDYINKYPIAVLYTKYPCYRAYMKNPFCRAVYQVSVLPCCIWSIRFAVLYIKYTCYRAVYYYSKYPSCRTVYPVRAAVFDILISIHVKHIARS